MTFELALLASLSTVGGLLIWRLTVGLTGRIEPAAARPAHARFDAPAPDDARLLPCPGSCPGQTWQRLDGDGWALCGCGAVQRADASATP